MPLGRLEIPIPCNPLLAVEFNEDRFLPVKGPCRGREVKLAGFLEPWRYSVANVIAKRRIPIDLTALFARNRFPVVVKARSRDVDLPISEAERVGEGS